MDLTKVVLPTFILEPKSFLEKMADFMVHPQFLLRFSWFNDTAEWQRIVIWIGLFLLFSGIYQHFISGQKLFSIVNEGCEETLQSYFRGTLPCLDWPSRWFYNSVNSRTSIFCSLIQVSHHPPISCFHFENREAGFVVDAFMEPKSKYLGNSAASILHGNGTLYDINRGHVGTFMFFFFCSSFISFTISGSFGSLVAL